MLYQNLVVVAKDPEISAHIWKFFKSWTSKSTIMTENISLSVEKWHASVRSPCLFVQGNFMKLPRRDFGTNDFDQTSRFQATETFSKCWGFSVKPNPKHLPAHIIIYFIYELWNILNWNQTAGRTSLPTDWFLTKNFSPQQPNSTSLFLQVPMAMV